MAFSDIARRVGKFTADNSPSILTAIGVVGTVTTAYLTGRGAYKAAKIIEEEKVTRDEDRESPYEEPTTREKIELTWHQYVPAVGSAALTIAAIVCANRVGTHRAAALAAAYSISERMFAEYKEKVKEKIGEKKEGEIRDEITQERVDRASGSEVVFVGHGDVLCFDEFTGRHFSSTMEKIKAAENKVNHSVLHHNQASLSEFYSEIGLEPTSMSDEIGWSSTGELLEVRFTSVLKDNKPVLAIDFNRTEPIRGYYRSY